MNTEILNLLKEGSKYTFFGVSESFGFCNRREFTYKQYMPERDILAVLPKGKRKIVGFQTKGDVVVFEGWDIPLKIDSDFSSFTGNTLINFVGSPEEVKEQLKGALYLSKEIITISPEDHTSEHNQMLYPEEAQANAHNHAVVRTILKEMGVTA